MFSSSCPPSPRLHLSFLWDCEMRRGGREKVPESEPQSDPPSDSPDPQHHQSTINHTTSTLSHPRPSADRTSSLTCPHQDRHHRIPNTPGQLQPISNLKHATNDNNSQTMRDKRQQLSYHTRQKTTTLIPHSTAGEPGHPVLPVAE